MLRAHAIFVACSSPEEATLWAEERLAPTYEYSCLVHLLVQAWQIVCQDNGQDVEEAKVDVETRRVLRQTS